MKIGAIQKFSLIDYPGKICAIIFAQGCNFRCPYCHNPELVLPGSFGACLSEQDIFLFLEKRRGKLDAVTITGGEPTIQSSLATLIKKIKSLDYAVKLDTNGSRPDILRDLLNENLLDYVAMDLKAPLAKYGAIARVEVQPEAIERSMRMIRESGIDHEFRTTVVKTLLSEDDLMQMAVLIGEGERYVLQKFVSNKLVEPSLLEGPQYGEEEYLAIKGHLQRFSSAVSIR